MLKTSTVNEQFKIADMENYEYTCTLKYTISLRMSASK